MRGCFFGRAGMVGGLIIVVGALVSALPLEAAVEEFSIRASPELANHSAREFQVPQFDPSLGILQSVTFELQGTGGFYQRFAHFGFGRGFITVDQDLSLILQTLNHENLVSANQVENHIYSFAGAHRGSDFAGHFEAPHSYGVTATASRTFTSDSYLEEFTGKGVVDLFLNEKSSVHDHFLRGNGLLEALVDAGANITVQYNYGALPVIAVPEVGTWVAGGLVLLYFIVRICRGQVVCAQP